MRSDAERVRGCSDDGVPGADVAVPGRLPAPAAAAGALRGGALPGRALPRGALPYGGALPRAGAVPDGPERA